VNINNSDDDNLSDSCNEEDQEDFELYTKLNGKAKNLQEKLKELVTNWISFNIENETKVCLQCKAIFGSLTDDMTLLKHSLNHLNEEMFKDVENLLKQCLSIEKLLKCYLCNTFSSTYEKSYDHFIEAHLKSKTKYDFAKTQKKNLAKTPNKNIASLSIDDQGKMAEMRELSEKLTQELGYDFNKHGRGECKCKFCPEPQKPRRITDMRIHVFTHLRTMDPSKYALVDAMARGFLQKNDEDKIYECKICRLQQTNESTSHVIKYHFSTRGPPRILGQMARSIGQAENNNIKDR